MSLTSKELAEFCQAEGFGTVGEDLFYSFLPDAPDDAVAIFDTGGWAPDSDLSRRDPTFQFQIRGADYDSAMVKAQAILSFFHGKELFSVGNVLVHKSVAMQSNPFPLGRDGNGRDKLVVNFTFTIH